ncbi:MAG TPA: cytochrome c [Woeseiaceae bacterium]
MQRRIPVSIAAVASLGIGAFSANTLADPSPEDAKDYRQAVMSSLGGHVKAISLHVRGLVDYDGYLAKHAEALALSASEIEQIFPAGSNVGDSEALPAIWDDPDAFAEAVAQLKEATAAFADATASGDEAAMGSAFRDVGKACKGCHDRFRKDDD